MRRRQSNSHNGYAKRFTRIVRVLASPLLCIGLLAAQWAPASLSPSAFSDLFVKDAGAAAADPYSTAFPNTENPISEGGSWLSGKATGIDFSDVRTTPGRAFGTQGGSASGASTYADSTAILTGT